MGCVVVTIDPSPWASWAQIASVVAAVVVWAYARHRARVKSAAEIATAKAELSARLDRQDDALASLTDGFTRQFGTNGFVLHEKVRGLEAEISVVRADLKGHVEQHVDRSFGR